MSLGQLSTSPARGLYLLLPQGTQQGRSRGFQAFIRQMSRPGPLFTLAHSICCKKLQAVNRVLKTTFGFDDLPEVLRELRKAAFLTGEVYYSERIEIQISKGERHTGQNPGEAMGKFQAVLVQLSFTDNAKLSQQ